MSELTELESVQAVRPSRLFVQAVQESNLGFFQKFKLRSLYLVPNVRESVNEYVDNVVTEQALTAGQDVSTMANGDIIKIILDRLPEIMALIELIIRLLG